MPRQAGLTVHGHPDTSAIHVAVGIVRNANGDVFIQMRDGGPFAGLWEYPGGKVEDGEQTRKALERELAEELGIVVADARPLIRVRHCYSDREVLLDVFEVLAYKGVARGVEGQRSRWVAPAALSRENMLPADAPITAAVNLPVSDTHALNDRSDDLFASIEHGGEVTCLCRICTFPVRGDQA